MKATNIAISKTVVFLWMPFIAGLSVSAQNLTELEGRVYSNDRDFDGTHIVNQTKQRATITAVMGFL